MFTARLNLVLQHRLRRELSFVRARLSPEGLFGLYFTIGTVVFVGAAWIFGAMAEDVVNRDLLVLIDERISDWFRSHAPPRFKAAAHLATALASTAAISILFAMMSCFFLWKRRWYGLLKLVLAVPGGMLLDMTLKNLFDRARPGWADPVLALSDYSFPSGHTMMATIVYGFIAIYVIHRIASWPWRVFVATTAILLVLLVALSRMDLGAHYLSDVLAAMAAGIAWLAFCLTAVETLRRYRVDADKKLMESRQANGD